jgi:hypothetical protein
VKDLKARGMLDDTLVIWGGEFGRTPMNESRGEGKFMGRDHHPRAFTMWMAGGGIKPGVTVGATTISATTSPTIPVHVHDLHATAAHLMGIDHLRLTTKFQGREYRLTDVHGSWCPSSWPDPGFGIHFFLRPAPPSIPGVLY